MKTAYSDRGIVRKYAVCEISAITELFAFCAVIVELGAERRATSPFRTVFRAEDRHFCQSLALEILERATLEVRTVFTVKRVVLTIFKKEKAIVVVLLRKASPHFLAHGLMCSRVLCAS